MASSRHPQAHPHSSAAHILHRNRKRHHPRPGAGGGTSVEGDDEGEGGMGMSSSRDASEEDNDDTSNFSDSASSLRHSIGGGSQSNQSTTGGRAIPSSSDPNNLPTSARDRVLVNSNPAGRKLSHSGGATATQNLNLADKTPSSSSPPKHGGPSSFHNQEITGSSSSKDRRPSASTSRGGDPTAITLQTASAVLASSAGSSAELQQSIMRPIVRRNLTNSSSAGSGDELGEFVPSSAIPTSFTTSSSNVNVSPPSATPRSNPGGGLHLGSLPLPNTNSTGAGAFATPRAQLQPFATATSSSKDQQQSSLNSNNSSGGQEEDDEEDTDKEREEFGENDGGSETDGATYDGDVEFAARTPASTLLQSGHTPGASSGGVNLSIQGGGGHPSSNSNNSSSAPREAPSRSYLDIIRQKLGDSESKSESVEEKETKIEPPSPIEIQKWFQSVLDGTDENGKLRDYKINRPVDEGRNENRPIRIYADGVYDLFHYAHMLQLRQAKLSFPQVHLIVGVCSSSDCTSHKNTPVLTSSERYTAVKNCRWVDEVLEDAPWVIDQTLIDVLKIDYVAHDEAPYGGKDSQDIYKFVKDQGKFLPTRRTPGVSTSELLGRIVDQYRHHNFDGKLEKLGLGQLSWKDQEEEKEKK